MAANMIAKKILKGEIGVLPTDTIYGLVGSALQKKAVVRIYKARKRNPSKPFIILINSIEDLEFFSIEISAEVRKSLRQFWPGKVSVILPCPRKKYEYLHKGTKTLAFRLPAKKSLRRLLKRTGPLVAPSANPEGLPPAKTIREARRYFGEKIDFYVDGGKIVSPPSTLIVMNVKNARVYLKRKGAINIRL